MIFGTSIPNATGHQTAIQFPTSPNICFYTTWGKQNKRNMHWNEQQTSTNWRLDRIKIWSRWSELTKYIVYLLSIVFPAIKRVAGDTFMFQRDSAPAHRHAKRSTVGAQNPRFYLFYQPEWPKYKPNVIYACYFNKIIILPCIKCNISLVLFSPGSVEADVGWGGKLNSHLMASCFRNICAKNCQNPLILSKVTIDNVGVPFFETQCSAFQPKTHSGGVIGHVCGCDMWFHFHAELDQLCVLSAAAAAVVWWTAFTDV